MTKINFYSIFGLHISCIDITAEFYNQLKQSEFSKIITTSRATIRTMEGDDTKLFFTRLTKINRKKLKTFLLEAIATESALLLKRFNDGCSSEYYSRDDDDLEYCKSPAEEYFSAEDCLKASSNLGTLLQILNCLEDETYYYIERF